MSHQMVGPQRHGFVSNDNESTIVNHHHEQNNEKNEKQQLIEDVDIDSGYYMHRHKLGEGGFGKVRLATHLKTREKVAIKCMSKAKLGDDLFRVYVEIEALKHLQHENIAKLLQVIETKENIYLVLEYCSGGELFDYLVAKSRLSELESRSIMIDLVNALAFLHANGFAHRDLKPENILFDGNHRIKLIDFGLAANCKSDKTSLLHLSTCCGSPAYAAPELLLGKCYSGPAVDIWSAGILLYALLVGRLPFDDDNIKKLYEKIQRGIFHMPIWLTREAKDLITSMLQIEPLRRITINQILNHPWIVNYQNSPQKNPYTIQKQHLDEEIVWECHKLFPDIPINELRHSIMTKFGYHTSTYLLLKQNPKTFITPQKPSYERFSLSTECVLDSIDETKERDFETKSFEIVQDKENDQRPKLLGAKRKINDWVLANSSPKKSYNPFTARPVRPSISPQNKVSSDQTPHTPTKIPVLAKPCNGSNPGTPNKVIVNPFASKSPIGSPIPSKKMKFNVKSPLRDYNLKDNGIVKEKVSIFNTPAKQKIENTPKKSLFKRILETATPSKTHQPRVLKISTSNKNITLTNFIDPQQCINKLIETLSVKGIECKQKEFSLRCVYSTKFAPNLLTFNLEICKFNERCVIQRKRLRGDAWNYKRFCEEILRISNESVVNE